MLNTKCDADELKHQLLLKFYELAKEPEKWKEDSAFESYNDLNWALKAGVFSVHQWGTINKYELWANGRRVASSGFQSVEVEPAKVQYAVRNWFGFKSKVKTPIGTTPAVTEQIPDQFHQTCASLFAAWDDLDQCTKFTEALQSLSGKQLKATKVEAKPVVANRPRKAPPASVPATKRKSPGSSKK